MAHLYYLAYGSNLHPLRLRERTPSAEVMGIIDNPGYRISFAKRGRDDSGKCTLHATDNGSDKVYGILYRLSGADKPVLDRYEGLGFGYREEVISAKLDGLNYRAFSYIAQTDYVDRELQPYDWYKQLVVLGARHHRLSATYIAELDRVVSKADRESSRRLENYERVQRILDYNARHSA